MDIEWIKVQYKLSIIPSFQYNFNLLKVLWGKYVTAEKVDIRELIFGRSPFTSYGN
jgi:hypothetical protein